MATNKIALRSVEEFMADYTSVYTPIYPLLMGRSVQYPRDVSEVTLRRVETFGDIRSGRITPKDTGMKQIAVGEGRRTYKKYFLGSQFIISSFQNSEGIDDVTRQVLDEHHRQFDELVLLGDGASLGTQINNGLHFSSDPNYTLNSSAEIKSGTSDTRLLDFHAKVMTTAEEADRVAGSKIIIFYGSDIIPLVNSLYASGRAFRESLQSALGSEFSIMSLPTDTNLAGGQGWTIVNRDQVKFHYSVLPELMARGVNEEKNYAWSNFLMGSAMVEVTAPGGIIRQPATLESAE